MLEPGRSTIDFSRMSGKLSFWLCSLPILKNKLKLGKKRLCGVTADVADTLHVMLFGVIPDSGGLSAVPGDKVGGVALELVLPPRTVCSLEHGRPRCFRTARQGLLGVPVVLAPGWLNPQGIPHKGPEND
jgi:hypothetical protein